MGGIFQALLLRNLCELIAMGKSAGTKDAMVIRAKFAIGVDFITVINKFAAPVVPITQIIMKIAMDFHMGATYLVTNASSQ